MKFKTDSKIQTDVIQELAWDPSVVHEHIGVTAKDGIVTLSGKVPNYIQKSAAEKAAQRVLGVKAVVEKIEVKLIDRFIKDDQSIAKAIADQFSWNVQVPDNLVKVKVENGWVTLTGEVEWDYQRNAAESCVRSLAGVQGVSSKISIKAKKIQSETIKQKIEEALKREVLREVKNISIEVRGSKVILTGNLRSFADMEDAKWAAWSSPGVTSVENNMQIGVQ